MKYIILQYKSYVFLVPLILEDYSFITLTMKYILFKERIKIFDTLPYIGLVYVILKYSGRRSWQVRKIQVRYQLPINKGHKIFSSYTALDININLNNVYSPITPGSFPFVKLERNSCSLPCASCACHIFFCPYTKKYDILHSSRLHKLEQHRDL